MNVDDLTQTMAQYNGSVNDISNTIVGGVRPVALVIIGVFYLIDQMSWSKYLKQEGGTLTLGVWLELSYRFIIAVFLASFSTVILNFVFALVNIAVSQIAESIDFKSIEMGVTVDGIDNWFLKGFLEVISLIVTALSVAGSGVVLLLRYFQMYILKCLAPLIVAFFVAESTKPISLNFIKMFSASAVQGVVLIIVMALYPAMAGSGVKVPMPPPFEETGTAIGAIAMGLIYLFMLFGSQALAKRVFQVN